MSVTIKTFYEKSSGSPEIRRFPLNTNELDCFLQTKEKIAKLYPVLADGYFQLFWKDSDGDRIAFSSDEEMRDALNYVTDGVFRVYIPEIKETSKPKGNDTKDKAPSSNQQQQQQQSRSSSTSSSWSSSQSQSQREEPLHPGVTCDGCEGPVKGIRFKCRVCPDFDLCSGCKKDGLHPEHDMIQIAVPRIHSFGFLPPQFSQYIHTGAHNAAHAAATAAATAAAQAAASSFGCSNSNAETGQNREENQERQGNHDDYLRNVGANIAAFLDPFGIDVTYDVHHNNGGHQQHGHWSGPCGGNRRSFWRGGSGCPAWQGMDRRTGCCKKESEKASGVKKENNTDTDSAGPMETGEPQANKNGDTSAGPDVPMKDNSKDQASRPGSDEWTFVPDDGSEVNVTPSPDIPIPMPAPPSATSPKSDGNGSNSMPQGAVPPPNPAACIYPDLRLQQSLEQMLAMGFSNTDNWLSDLLMENNCDIGQTLDAIKAKATQQLDSLRK